MDPAITVGLGAALHIAGFMVIAGVAGKLVIAILNYLHNLQTRIEILERQRKAEAEVITVLGQLADNADKNPGAPVHTPGRTPQHPSQRDISTPPHLRLISAQDACHDTKPEKAELDAGTNTAHGIPRSPGEDTATPIFCPDRTECSLL